MSEKVGFVGLRIMGKPMPRRFLYYGTMRLSRPEMVNIDTLLCEEGLI